MKKLSLPLLSKTVAAKRKTKALTQAELSKLSGINRTLLSRLEGGTYTPSVDQLAALSQILEFDMATLFTEDPSPILQRTRLALPSPMTPARLPRRKTLAALPPAPKKPTASRWRGLVTWGFLWRCFWPSITP